MVGAAFAVKYKKPIFVFGAIAIVVIGGFVARPWETKPAPKVPPPPPVEQKRVVPTPFVPHELPPAPTAVPPAPAPRLAPNPPVATAKPDDLEGLAKDLMAPGNTFFDPEYRVTGKYPEGWSMRTSARWGTKETTLFFADPEYPAARPSLYYRIFPEPMQLADAQVDGWLREQAVAKANQRVTSGMADYVNGEMVSRMIGDRPALTWTGSYTRNGEPWGEYLTRIYSPTGTTLFFMNARAENLPALIPKFERMINTTIVP